MRQNNEPKIKYKSIKQKLGGTTIVILGKLWKTIKIKTRSIKTDFAPGSRLHLGKVLSPYNTHPKIIPLIKYTNGCVLFLIFIFPKSNKKKILKRSKNTFV